MTTTTIAAGLRELADKLAAAGIDTDWVFVEIQPVEPGDVAFVDQVAAALGVEAEDKLLATGTILHRDARAQFGPVRVAAFTHIPETPERRRSRLVAELAELDAKIAVTP